MGDRINLSAQQALVSERVSMKDELLLEIQSEKVREVKAKVAAEHQHIKSEFKAKLKQMKILMKEDKLRHV